MQPFWRFLSSTMILSGTRHKILIGAMIGALACMIVLSLYRFNLLESFELKLHDLLCRLTLRHAKPPDEIALVVVDQGSLEAAQRQGVNWPWPRQMYAPILQFCKSSGARAVVSISFSRNLLPMAWRMTGCWLKP